MDTSFDKTWNDVYSSGNSINEYPFTDFVSFFSNNFSNKEKKLNILEVGCGAGNNLVFLAKKGHNVFGVDGSKEIIDYTIKKFSDLNLTGNFINCEFTELPYDDNFFDLIINRAAICHTDFFNANIAIKECNRVIKPKHIFYSTFFTNLNTFKANKIDFGFYNNFKEGFKNIGALKFYNVFELRSLFEKNNFTITNLYLIEKKDMLSIPSQQNSEWILHSEKME